MSRAKAESRRRRVRHILVPTDFEACSRRASSLAITLAAALEARVTLLHVYYVPSFLSIDEAVSREISQKVARESETALLKEAQRAMAQGEDPRLVLTTCLLGGRPEEEILRFAAEHEVDLIVMGTHGGGRFSRAVLGSVSDRILRQASVPVLLVPRIGASTSPRDRESAEAAEEERL